MTPDYILIQGDVDCGVALCDRNTGAVLLNEGTTPALTINGQTSLYLSGCRGSVVREGATTNFWVFVQDFTGPATLFLTRIVVTPPAGTATVPTFATQSFTLSIANFSRQSARWLPDGSIIFAAGLSVYKFFPGTGTASAIFTAASGDGSFSNGEALRLSNVSNAQVLALTPAHIYQVNAASGTLINAVAITAFGLAASTLPQCLFDGAHTAWVIAEPSPGANGNVYALNLSAITKAQLTTGTDYSTYVMALNTVAGVLGLVLNASATITTVAINGGAVNTGTLPALSTGALAVDDAGYFWTADNFATDIGTPTWKIDPISLAVVLTIGSRFFGSAIPAGDVPRAQDFGFATPGIVIGHAANLNAYDNGGALAPAFPPGNGELIENIEPLRNWCRANGISIALCQDSQRTAKDLLDELLTVGNSAPVYSGDRLKIIPYDEVSAAGFGAIYISPTAAGPVADLADLDFVSDGKTPPVKFTRKRRASCDNVVAIEHIDRTLDYAHNVTTEIDQMHVTLYGPRKGGTLDAAELGLNVPSGSKSLLSIHSSEVAQAISSILAKRGAAGVNEYEFTLKAEWLALEAMDLVTISDSRLGLVKVPVRLTSAKENSNRELDCKAEAFVYGLNHPDVKATTAATGTLVLANVDPGLVNTPIIFEPPAGMLPAGSSPQVWMLVSGADPNYGGCIANASVDGGTISGGPTRTVASLTAHNVTSAANYNQSTFPALFTGTTNHDGVTSSVDSSLMDDSENAAAPMTISKENLRNYLPAGAPTRIACHLQAWWGFTSHPSIGFSDQNQTDMTAIAVDLAERGYDVLIPDWYSPTVTTVCNDNTVDKISVACGVAGIKYMIMIDEQYWSVNSHAPADYQSSLITAINHLMDTYASDASYEKKGGRPLVLLWDINAKALSDGITINWNTVRAAVTSHSNPLLIQYQASGFSVVQSDGALSWVDTNADTTPVPSGSNYLNSFFSAASAHPGLLALSSVWKGFNGTLTASVGWSLGKYIAQRAGQTWLDVWKKNADYISGGGRLDYICTVTGDDFEEGTAIQCGIRTDIAITASLSGTVLSFSVTGNENTVRQYNLWGTSDGTNATLLSTVLVGAPKQFDLTSLPGLDASGTYTLYVEAQGMPSLQNHVTSGITGVALTGGPATFNPLGNIGPATTGTLTATFASGTDPDTTDTLAVDLTESNGSLSTQSQQLADGSADPCFVEGASGFEVVCPTVATLTSAEHYSLTTYIRRGVGGTVIMAHASGKRFGVLDGATFKIDLPAQWVGKTIHLKFQAYNKLGGQLNPLSECVDYTFTPVGSFLPGGFYVNGG